MKRFPILLLMICLLLSGCMTWFDGNYHSVSPHQEHGNQPDTDNMRASKYTDLLFSLEQMIHFCTENGVINVEQYDQSQISQDMDRAVADIQQNNPIGAYAVKQIRYEIGTSAGQPAVAVSISYVRTLSEIRKVRSPADSDMAKSFVTAALDECAPELVMYLNDLFIADFGQWIDDYATLHPDVVMEIPTISVNYYPETGVDRIVELKFIYQTSRETLRNYQSRVLPIFEAAQLYVSGDGSDAQKYAQLYSFLMERYDYQYQTSITPSYSLLIHGVGDAKAFATAYAAMCRRAGLECRTVSGTRDGEAWFWNLILMDETYVHLDLLRSNQNGAFRTYTDEQMNGYVWDYSAYPTAYADTAPANVP